MGNWKAVKECAIFGNRPVAAIQLNCDIGENHDLAKEHPEILQKLVSAYDGYGKDVGIVIPQIGNVSTAITTTEEVAPT